MNSYSPTSGGTGRPFPLGTPGSEDAALGLCGWSETTHEMACPSALRVLLLLSGAAHSSDMTAAEITDTEAMMAHEALDLLYHIECAPTA